MNKITKCLSQKDAPGGRYAGGLSRDLNPGPLAPEARIIPLDQQAPPECRDAKKDSNGITPSSRTNGLWASLAQW